MSGETRTYYVLTCDRCGAEYGGDGDHRNAMECRATAFNLGWRFPAQTKADGAWARTSSDACPECVPDWVPLPARKERAS